MKNKGLSDNTLQTTSHKLNQLGRNADLTNPKEVETYIANYTVTNATKQKLVNSYQYFCKINQINWERPKYKRERKLPLIPTTENIHKIISATSTKYAAIFKILEETGLETQELATTNRRDIDAEQGIINAQGCKGHNSRSLKLKPETADLLRTYLSKYTSEKPFPHRKEWANNGEETETDWPRNSTNHNSKRYHSATFDITTQRSPTTEPKTSYS